LGVNPDARLDLASGAMVADLIQAIVQHENGQQPYSRELILRGVSMA